MRKYLAIKYFRKNGTSQKFDSILNTPMEKFPSFCFGIIHLVRTQFFLKKLTFLTTWYALASKRIKSKKSGKFYVLTKWMIPFHLDHSLCLMSALESSILNEIFPPRNGVHNGFASTSSLIIVFASKQINQFINWFFIQTQIKAINLLLVH